MNDYRVTLAPYALFLWSALGMLVGGATLQYALPLQWGLLATEFGIVLGLTLVARYFFTRVDLDATWRSLGTWDISVPALVLLVVTAPILGIAANLVAALTVELIPALQPMAEAYEGMTDELFPTDDPLMWGLGALSVIVAAPLCEEFLFRGTIQPLQERAHRSHLVIIVVNGLLFGLIHFNPLSFLALSIVGAFLADITSRSRSLWPAIIGHAVLNAFNGIVFVELAAHYNDVQEEATLVEILGAMALVLPVVGIAWFALRRLMPRPPRQ